MRRVQLCVLSLALLVALFSVTAFTNASPASAHSVQRSSSKLHTAARHAATGGPRAMHITQKSSAKVTCSGNGCNGQNPAATGCEADAYTVQTAVFSNSYVELRYSPTCGTNWGRVTSKVGPANLVIRSQRIDGLTYTFSGGKYNYAFSGMVYAPTVKARACGGINGISGCTAYV